MNDSENVHAGGCLCGAVRYTVRGPLRDVVHCHCAMCRRLHGGFGPHTKARKQQITLEKDAELKWYTTSSVARRGFCGRCGANLFWEPFGQDATGILAGTLDQPSKLKTLGHIFVAEKADFYEITDGTPQFPGSSQGVFAGDSLSS